MKKVFSKFNPNWIAVFILVGAFVVSAVRFYNVSGSVGSGEDGEGASVIRVAHWQLEPGFREAMQWVIDEYNNLPQVKEAGVTVMQTPISERVYQQFMNVHLISGTAPDIAVKKESNLVKGNALAKFYTPLGEYVEAPNPYNAVEYQLSDLSEEFSRELSQTAWRDTFFDGLQGGYESVLSDYYAIPVSTWGGTRIIYNLSILEEAKAFALDAAQQENVPDWLEGVWRTGSNPDGYLSQASGLEWLANDQIPQTLGQLFLYCHAIQAYASGRDIGYLVPIAGSSYSQNNFSVLYEWEFMSGIWEELSIEPGGSLAALETLIGFERGVWNFDSPFVREYFNFMDAITAFYPQGYLGLDREQAQRRFVLGQAAMLSTGGWDATSIYQGIEQRDDPKDRFKIEIASEPFPAEGERWSNILTMRASEADAKGGVPLAINKQTPHFDWCLDFLRFLSSHRMSEEFAQRAGWVPVISGARPPKAVEDFMPIQEGLPKTLAINMADSSMPANIRNVWSSMTKLYATGDIGYEEMAERITEAFKSPVIGTRKAWITTLLRVKDQSRANQRSMSVERLSALQGDEDAAKRERSNTYLNVQRDEGIYLYRWWHELHPGEPYPAY